MTIAQRFRYIQWLDPCKIHNLFSQTNPRGHSPNYSIYQHAPGDPFPEFPKALIDTERHVVNPQSDVLFVPIAYDHA